MHAAIRSPMVAGIALVGAGAIAVSPMAASLPAIHMPTLQLTATQRPTGIIDPVTVFAPIFAQTLTDVQQIITNQIANPAPILQAVLQNQTNNALNLANGLGEAGADLGNAALATPAAVLAATKQVLAGNLTGALRTLESVTLQPLGAATVAVVRSIQNVLQNELAIAGRLAVALPTAAMGIVAATVNAVAQTTRAIVVAGLGVVSAAATFNPVNVVNAITEGAANVTSVFVQTTIGQPQIAKQQVAKTALARQQTTPSIATAINQGRAEIAQAIVPQKRAEKAEVAATSTATVASSTTTQTAAVTAVKSKVSVARAPKAVAPAHKDSSSVAKAIKKALGGAAAKKAKAAK
jgi:hypothetical protein